MRCTRCGREATESDKFCAECGMFLRDAWVDHRLMLALACEQRGDHRAARRELERLTESEPDHILANHLLGSMYFHQGTLDLAIERYRRALERAPRFFLCSYDLAILQVNSLHHQGIKDLAPSLVAVGHAPDELVEAIELPAHPFGIAVQWHPEWLTDQQPMRRLFSAFVEASSR